MALLKSLFQCRSSQIETVLSSTYFHYRCALSLILTSTVPGVTRVTIGIEQNRVWPFNDLVLLVYFFTFSIMITSLGEEGAGLCASRAFVCLFYTC